MAFGYCFKCILEFVRVWQIPVYFRQNKHCISRVVLGLHRRLLACARAYSLQFLLHSDLAKVVDCLSRHSGVSGSAPERLHIERDWKNENTVNWCLSKFSLVKSTVAKNQMLKSDSISGRGLRAEFLGGYSTPPDKPLGGRLQRTKVPSRKTCITAGRLVRQGWEIGNRMISRPDSTICSGTGVQILHCYSMNHATRAIWKKRKRAHKHGEKIDKHEFDLLLVGLDISDAVLC